MGDRNTKQATAMIGDSISTWLFGGWFFGASRDANRAPVRDAPEQPTRASSVAGATDPLIAGLSTRALLARIQSGDRAAFETVYRALFDTLWSLAASITRSGDVADDIVHDVFLWFWTRRQTVAVETDPRTYLASAIRHKAYNLIQHRRTVDATERATSDSGAHPPALGRPFPLASAAAETHEFQDAYQRALALLTDRERIAALLRWEEGMTFEQIGLVLSLSKMGAQKVVLRAQAKVQDGLAKYRD